nr:hypothetical protein [uncultured Cellulosilyticum sp.]
MYYVPDGTKKCGYYECEECGERFLSLHLEENMECPYCEKDFDPEIGPDEVMEDTNAIARLQRILEGEEEIEKWDKLLSLAITGGDEEWL